MPSSQYKILLKFNAKKLKTKKKNCLNKETLPLAGKLTEVMENYTTQCLQDKNLHKKYIKECIF